jgi:tRNA (guanosine-2'-O-)-methyltransferase
VTFKGLPYHGPRRSDRTWTREEILERLTDERRQRIQDVVDARVWGVVPVLESLYDPANVSAIFRTVEALGLLRVVVTHADAPRKLGARKVSRGSEKWIRIDRHASSRAAALALRQEGFRILVTDADAPQTLYDLDLRQPTAFVFGNEHDGVSDELRAEADGTVSIPLPGFTRSLNVSVAAGILLAEARRRRCEALAGASDLPPDERERLFDAYLQQTFLGPDADRSPRMPEWVGRRP